MLLKTQKVELILPGLVLFFILMLWEIVPSVFDIPPYIFPSLSEVFLATFSNNDELVGYFYATTLESFLGFVVGSTIGFLIGVFMAESKYFSYVALPYVIASNAVPVIAIAPIVIMWFGNGLASKVVVSSFLCFFPLAINTYKGLSTYSKDYEELFDVYGAKKIEFLLNFKLQNSFPFIFSGLKLNATFSVIGSVVAEIIASNVGLGYGMLQALYTLNIPKLWGYVLLSCLLGVFAYLVVNLFEKRLNIYSL